MEIPCSRRAPFFFVVASFFLVLLCSVLFRFVDSSFLYLLLFFVFVFVYCFPSSLNPMVRYGCGSDVSIHSRSWCTARAAPLRLAIFDVKNPRLCCTRMRNYRQ